MFVQTILNIPTSNLSIKNQEMATRIYYKLFMLYAKNGQGKK